MGLAEQFAADLNRMIEASPTEFGYAGSTLTGRRSKLSSEFTLGDYGVQSGYKFSLRVLRSALPRMPREGEIVTIGAEEFRILNPVEIDALGVSVLLHLGGESD